MDLKMMEKRRATLDAFARAWAARDVDALLALMTVDCVYGASIGPEPGRTYQGHAEVRAGVMAMFAHDNDTTSTVTNVRFGNDHAFWEWHYFRRDAADYSPAAHGCDLFVFVADKIAMKQAFRKVQSE
jgi:ketosteroid isomerase-like protein